MSIKQQEQQVDQMPERISSRATLKPHVRAIYIVFAIMFILLGILGILVPVIPGLLFLAVAVFLLGKVSHRVRRWSETRPMLKSLNQRMERMEGLNLGERVKVTLLIVAESLLLAIGQVSRYVGRLIDKTRRK